VDVIAAGHTHGGLAHLVDGIGIIQPFSRGQSFGRVDLVVDRRTRRVVRVQPFAPHQIVPSLYEGKAVMNDPAIVHAMAGAPSACTSCRPRRSALA
jgi:2',3'-cyclic-nucleotide 2'-phosphodiesterase (5'-nucleotidase family)